MEMIAEASGVARRTLYYAFPEGKEQILHTAIERLWERRPFLARLVREEPYASDPRAGLEEIGRFLYEFWTSDDNIALVRVIIQEPGRFPHITREYFEPRSAQGYGRIVGYMRHLAKAGFISAPDPVLAARHFTGLIRDPLFWPTFTGERSRPISQKKLVSAAVDLFLEGAGRRDALRRLISVP